VATSISRGASSRCAGVFTTAGRVELPKNPAYVKAQMGHHSIKVTVDIYGDLVPGANRGAVDRLDVSGRNSRARAALVMRAAAT
jgi:hypothetical protein